MISKTDLEKLNSQKSNNKIWICERVAESPRLAQV